MSSTHLFNIETMKLKFQEIIQTQYEILERRSVLTHKLSELKLLYGDLVKNNTKKIFLFCLDSFYFQYKSLVLEMDNINRYISMVSNRTYGDYYKLYHIIITQTNNANINIDLLTRDFQNYTPYKDLEPFHEYKITDIIRLHNDILRIINHLYAHYLSKERDILDYSTKVSAGISVGNFMQTLCYENTLFREQILLYVNYISFFHTAQHGRLLKLYQRISVFYREIEEDVLNNGSANLTSHNNNDNMMALQEYMTSNSIKRREFIENTINIISNESQSKPSDTEVLIEKLESVTQDVVPVIQQSIPKENIKLVLVNPTEESVKEPVQEPVKERVQESVQEPVKELVQEPVKELVQESVKELV